MKKIQLIFLFALLLFALPAGASEQVEKEVGTIVERAQVTQLATNGASPYGYQYYLRDMSVDASESEFENLVLKMRVYIENFDTPGSLSILEDAGFGQIELGNELDAINTYIMANKRIKFSDWLERPLSGVNNRKNRKWSGFVQTTPVFPVLSCPYPRFA